jgi:hypothetical protein
VPRTSRVTAPDTTALLIDFLADAPALAHIHHEVYVDAQFDEPVAPGGSWRPARRRRVGVRRGRESGDLPRYRDLRTEHGYEVTNHRVRHLIAASLRALAWFR